MRNLFQFIFRHHFFFLFLIFETLSISMLVQNNFYQQAAFYKYSKEFSGSIQNTANNISEYFYLKKTNKKLAEENSALKNSSIKSCTKFDTSTFIFKDTLYKQQYKYIDAKVINNTVNRRNNYLTLNKGWKDGIGKDMSVITNNGIVGIVKSVSENFCSVLSILHSKCKISAKIKKNNFVGSVMWEGLNYQTGLLKDIPSHVKLLKGDTIITSGYSNIFPEGIPIGTILYYKNDAGENFYTIYIKFTTDYNKLNYVYVVKYLLKKEEEKLEQTTQND